MLGKILLTVIVILLAFVVLRQRHLAERQAARTQTAGKQAGKPVEQPGATPADSARDELSKDLRLAAWMFLVLMVGIGAAVYYFRWQDDHTVLTIRLYRDGQQHPVSYEVYKYQMGERSFTTIDGTQVTVAGSERMEIEGLSE